MSKEVIFFFFFFFRWSGGGGGGGDFVFVPVVGPDHIVGLSNSALEIQMP